MKIFAYCTEVAQEAVGAATGVEPVTSPPMTAADFDAHWMEGQDVIYIRLHGRENRAGWWGESKTGWSPLALAQVQIEGLDLHSTIVVVANCYGADADPMVAALYMAGASAVLAGEGENIAAAKKIVGTDLLVKWLIRGLALGLPLGLVLGFAKARLGVTSWWRVADRDARKFKIVKRKGVK